jgi:ribosome-associated toxin RatA of RatAB toxin-antitoxin module
MRLWFRSLTGHGPGIRVVLFGTALIFALGVAAQAGTGEAIRSRLDNGEIIVAAKDTPDSSSQGAEMTAIINAPPEVVWKIITDVNSFKFFMPRTINSMAVAAEKIPGIVLKHPTQAEEVEKLIGPTPANPADSRIPGGKYTVYHYSNLKFPWPCSNRWYIIKGIQDETRAAQHYYHGSWSLVIGNLKTNSGEWILEPYGVNQTKAIYRLNTDPGGAIPGFLIKEGTNSTMPQIMKAVRERAAKICKAG